MKTNNLIIHELDQGSSDWHQFRSEHFGASEASAMLGMSPYQSRSDLLKAKFTGISPEVNAATQRIFDKGHEVEALARVFIENRLNDDLYPVTASKGKLSASCDGLTMDESIAWECKQYNAKLYESIQNCVLPDHHWPQCQQVLYVTGAEKLMFTCSDGTLETTASMWVYPDPAQHDILVSGWAQFEKDLANYEHVDVIEAPKAEAIMQLPALSYSLNGLAITSNLDEYKACAIQLVENSKRPLINDQDFANQEALNKEFADSEAKLSLLIEQVDGEFIDVDAFKKGVIFIRETIRSARLNGEKQVKARKEAIKIEIMNAAVKSYADHKAALEAEISPIRLIVSQPNFAEAMKNKRTLASLNDSVNTELAAAKINADAVAKDIRAKLAWFRSVMHGVEFLFNDLPDLIYKAEDDFKLVVTARIETHQKAEAEKAEAQRKRIQAEEEAKAKAKQEQELEAERAKVRAEEQARIDEERRIYIPSVATIKTNATVKVTAQNIDDAIAQKRKAEDDRKNPPVKRRPSDDEILQAVALYFNADEETVLAWFTSMDLERLCIKAEA